MKKFLPLLLIWISNSALSQNAPNRYIELYKDAAIKQMNTNGVPASIILGVAMHESGCGTSKIARYLNNHFGMKGRNSSTQIKSAYKGYDCAESSYADFIGALKRRNQFSVLFDKFSDYDYRNWVIGIQRGGYAASKTWGTQVLAIINKYKLYQYDNRPVDYNESAGYDNPIGPAITKLKSIYYMVKRGDTLSLIAKRHNTTVASIKKKNSLRTANLEIGQKLQL